jgi:hypothetical protein
MSSRLLPGLILAVGEDGLLDDAGQLLTIGVAETLKYQGAEALAELLIDVPKEESNKR